MTTRHRAEPVLPRALAVMLLLAGCAAGEPSPSTSAAGSPSPTETAEPTPSPSPSPEPTAADVPALALEEVVAGLVSPIIVATTPAGWLFVNEQVGRVGAGDAAPSATEVVLDITDRVGSEDNEQGLLGLAFDPAWPEQQRAFIHYTDRDGDTVLSEFRVTDEPFPPRLDPTTERVLLQVDQPYPNHNGGQLAFGPDGFLYFALGDGGAGGDPHGHGQDATTLLGSILRLDVDGEEPYGIPADNPFADGTDGAPEVFLFGLRNPWRFSFDRETGLLWIGDVGQEAIEEIDRVDPATEGGANLGWNVMEGSHCFNRSQCETDGLTMPVAEYGHEQGCSVTGGYVYRGEALPDLRGWYLFSDYCSGTLFGIQADLEGVVAPRTLLETRVTVSAFGEGTDGELYLADREGGTLYRIVAAP